ncbi:hypothetical protein TNCV_4359971 [Trichonephila clavipes]|uniref:Tc1-like transposase DDE domain-containing protein n=1 Tax=Trichonephila clavipes TaxID=2585209 RepID=A0A8X6WAF4_TRICX|nr:hypothetical protein TNCV_4359971 [Trichonephila clavipes]
MKHIAASSFNSRKLAGLRQYVQIDFYAPQSPDLNPIEQLWDLLERKIRQHSTSSKNMLKSVLKDEWEKISDEETTKLVHSMPKRLQEVLER